MTCETALLLISGHIDGVNTDAEEQALQAHLSECADCRAILAAYESAEAGLTELEVSPPEGFARGVMYRIGQESGTEKKPRRRFIGPGTGIGLVAAVLVLLLGTGLIKLPLHAGKASEEAPAEENREITVYGPAETAADAYLMAPEAELAAVPAEVEGMDGTSAYRYAGLNGASDAAGDTPQAAEMPAETPIEAAKPAEAAEADSADMALCKQLGAPVLHYAEFGTELLDTVQKYAPALGERLAKLTPERVDGELRYETDTRTVLALHEWLLGQLPRTEDEDERVLEAESGVILRAQELDPEFGFLAEVFTLPEIPERIVWPESWPSDWPARFRLEQSWSLCFPDENGLPKGGDKAYLILKDNE